MTTPQSGPPSWGEQPGSGGQPGQPGQPSQGQPGPFPPGPGGFSSPPPGQYPPPGGYPPGPGGYPPGPGGYPSGPGGYPPGPGGPSGGGFGQPPRPNRITRNTIIAIVTVLVVAGAAIGIVVGTSGKKKHDAGKSGSSTTAPATSGSPASGGASGGGPAVSSGSGGDGSGGGAPSESDARTAVERYISDINKQDKNDAGSLVCSAAKAGWQSSVDGPGGDFTVVVKHFEFKTSAEGTQPNSIDVTYSIDAADRSDSSQTKSKDVTFTVINESGPKICNES